MHHCIIAITTRLLFKTRNNGNGTRLWAGADVDRIHMFHVYYATVLCCLWTNSLYVSMHWCMFELEYVCTIKISSQLYTRLLFKHTKTAMECACALALMLIEYIYCVYIMQRYRVGFGWTERTFVCICVYLTMNRSILDVRFDVTPSQSHTRLLFKHTIPAMQYAYALVLMLIEYILRIYYETVSCWFWTDRAYVGIGACLYLNGSWIGVQSTMTPSDLRTLHTCLMILNYNHNDVLLMVEYIYCVYIMERYRVASGRAESTLVCIGVCLKLNVSIVNVRYTMTPWQLRTRVLFNYNCNGMWLCTDAGKYMECVGFDRTESALVFVYVGIWMCHDLVTVTIRHNIIGIGKSPAI